MFQANAAMVQVIIRAYLTACTRAMLIAGT